MSYNKVVELLGKDADSLLGHKCETISKEMLQAPSPDFIDKVYASSNRSPQVLKSLGAILNHGRLAGTGYTSI